jgi:hypothetical protein
MMQNILGNNGLVLIINVFFYESDVMCWIVGEMALVHMSGVVWTLNLLTNVANSALRGLWCPQQNFFKMVV